MRKEPAMRVHPCFLGAAAVLAVLAVPATAQQVQVYQLPPGSYPHDVAPAPDEKFWYAAQKHGAIGIFDPKTGQSREVKLGPKSAPHGVIQGPDGAAWLTDGGQNAIVRFDPKTEEIKVWKLPEDTGYHEPQHRGFRQGRHSLVHGPERHLWPARSEIGRGQGVQ